MQWIFWQAELRATGLLSRLRPVKWTQMHIFQHPLATLAQCTAG